MYPKSNDKEASAKNKLKKKKKKKTKFVITIGSGRRRRNWMKAVKRYKPPAVRDILLGG